MSSACRAPPYDEIVQKYMGASTNVFAQYGQTGADIAEVILAAATAETPDFRYITSDFAKQVGGAQGDEAGFVF